MPVNYMTDVHLLTYNNYYNRLVKREETLERYLEQDGYLGVYQNINFDKGDGLNTQLVLGVGDYDGIGDYVVTFSQEPENTLRRWFIIESKKLRGGQYQLTLRRDVIADFAEIIGEAPCFVEKGYVTNNDPLILNNENMTFNQIKMKEYLLDGGSLKTPWLVAYLPRYDGDGNFRTYKGSFKDEPPTADYKLNSLSEYKYYKYTQDPYIYLASTSGLYFEVPFKKEQGYGSTYGFRLYNDSYKNNFFFTNESTVRPLAQNPTLTNPAQTWKECYEELQKYNTYDSETGLATNTYAKIGTYESYLTLVGEVGKIIQVGTGSSAKFYKITSSISDLTYEFNQETRLNKDTSDYGAFLWSKIAQASGMTWTSDAVCVTDVNWPYQNPGITLSTQEISNDDALNYNFDYDSIVTKNTPYEILVAPYYNVTLKEGTTTIAHLGDVAVNWFLDMAKAQGAVHDIQIVPYVGIDSNDLTGYKIVKCYYSIDKVQAWAVKLPYSQFSKEYPLSIPYNNNKKIGNSCDLYRLTSPNGIGNFDFNPAKNGGLVSYEVDCTLMPFNPYIKINPKFSNYSINSQTNLYGGDYDDYRGLICGGDFSLPIVTSSWETYQLQNKYQQDIFNRQISTLEFNNGWQLTETITGAATGAVSGAVTGAAVGSMIAPGVGTAVGAVLGGVASAVGGVVDSIKTAATQREQIDSMRDQYGYQMGNIKARPDTITKTTPYNINNKYFPYIEYYSCTEKEKEAFRDKLKYNGMTVMAIGKINDYLNPSEETFIKGKIIRLPENDELDYQLAQEIVNEIQQGVFVG